jgi:hypothetical protein
MLATVFTDTGVTSSKSEGIYYLCNQWLHFINWKRINSYKK